MNRRNQLSARLEHLVQNPLQGVIFQSGCDPLLVAQLLVHLIVLIVAVLLARYINPVVGRQRVLKPNPDAETNDSS